MKKILLVLLLIPALASTAFARKDGGNLRPAEGGKCVTPNGVSGVWVGLAKDGGNGLKPSAKKDGGNGVRCTPVFDPNGSWPNSRRLLIILKDNLADAISYMDENVLAQVIRDTPEESAPKPFVQGAPKMSPQSVTKSFLANVIRNVEYPSLQQLDEMEQKPPKGIRPFYYDIRTTTIKAMYYYFVHYGHDPLESVTDGEKRAIQEFMLREASHLWGFGDEQSESFARRLADALRISPYRGEPGFVRLKSLSFSGRTECDYLRNALNLISTDTIVFNAECVDTGRLYDNRPVFLVTAVMKINGCDPVSANGSSGYNLSGPLTSQENIIRNHGELYEGKAVVYSKYYPVKSETEGNFVVTALNMMLPDSQKPTGSLNGQMDADGDYIKGVRARLGGQFCDMSWEGGK